MPARNRSIRSPRILSLSGIIVTAGALSISGCKSPADYRNQADDVAQGILDRAWPEATGHSEDGFTILPAEHTLRERLLLDQRLPVISPASAGSTYDRRIEQWPDGSYNESRSEGLSVLQYAHLDTEPLRLSLLESLQVAAYNNRGYQSQKESVYQSALRLDLERDAFRATWSGVVDSVVSSSFNANSETHGVVTSPSLQVSKQFENGMRFTSLLAVDLVNLLNGSKESSTGLTLDTSLEIPLLRGSSRFVVTEPLTQAERDVVYAIYGFERFKRTFAVQIASNYLSVLQQKDRVQNAVENYERVVASTRRARRLADAGRLPGIQVDQSVQDELRARNSWISAQQSYERSLDSFKITLGLPTDAIVELDDSEFDELLATPRFQQYLEPLSNADKPETPPADAPVVLAPPSDEDAGPYELNEEAAIMIALLNRLDLRVAVGEIVDAQRGVAIAADNLRADVTLLGRASLGESRSLSSANQRDAQLRTDRGFYSLLLGIDLPIERTSERNSYRNALIAYEQTVRSLQDAEDSVKLDVRGVLRNLLEARESIKIQAEAVRVAQRRVDSTNLFLQAGRAEIRDLLEAQNALNSAQDALTNAVVNYRIGELELQRDLGVLTVRSDGLWSEFDPDEIDLQILRDQMIQSRPGVPEGDA
ncbi:MAG: TolC family protein [Phycisphaerales bacterium]|nr:TolC family protein [Phycisphaerales bacterium]